jgi:hypothetical protein
VVYESKIEAKTVATFPVTFGLLPTFIWAFLKTATNSLVFGQEKWPKSPLLKQKWPVKNGLVMRNFASKAHLPTFIHYLLENRKL